MYEFKNEVLLDASNWAIQQDTLLKMEQTLPMIEEYDNTDGNSDPIGSPLWDIIQEPLKEVYTIPLFKQEFCDMVLSELKKMQFEIPFKPNPEEDELRRIPEIVLENSTPDFYEETLEIVRTQINIILFTLFNRQVDGGCIQLANYNPRTIQQTSWHHDASADISIVVPLNTGYYEGGGTDFHNRGSVPPLPTGHGLIFPSFTHLHRGAPVYSGDRYLLVMWLTIDEKDRKEDRFR